MSDPRCPHCKATLLKVRPVRIKGDPDSRHWDGPVPSAMGFACLLCGTLLPLSPLPERGER